MQAMKQPFVSCSCVCEVVVVLAFNQGGIGMKCVRMLSGVVCFVAKMLR